MFTKASLYLASDPPDADWLRGVPGVESVATDLAHDGTVARHRVRINGVTLTMTVMDEEHVSPHLAGLYHWVLQQTDEQPSPHAGDVAAKIQATQTVLGCVLQPGDAARARPGRRPVVPSC